MFTNTVLKLGYLCFWRVNLSKQQKYNGKNDSIEIQSKLIVTYEKESTWHKQGESLLIAFLNIFAVLKNDKDHSKPLHSQHDNFLQQGNVESRKNLEQKFIVNSAP